MVGPVWEPRPCGRWIPGTSRPPKPNPRRTTSDITDSVFPTESLVVRLRNSWVGLDAVSLRPRQPNPNRDKPSQFRDGPLVVCLRNGWAGLGAASLWPLDPGDLETAQAKSATHH